MENNVAEPLDPYAQFEPDPYAQFDKPGVAQDVAKTTAPSALRGVIGSLTMPGTLSDLVDRGAGWAINKIAPDSKAAGAIKFLRGVDTNPKTGGSISDEHSFFPSFGTVHDKAEKVTGPLYEAQTPVGKGYQTGVEAVPSLLGGGSLVGTLSKAAGAGTGSALLGEGAKAAGDLLPKWAEPVGRFLGAAIGAGAPAAVRRARTPLPMTDERLANVNALNATNPELVSTSSAGQVTGRPSVMGLEGRSPRMADLPEKQAEAYTQGVMRQTGSTGMFDTAGIAEAKNTGAQLEALRNAHRMSPAEFASLNRDINAMGRPGSDLYRAVGPSKLFKEAQDEIRLGPTGGNPPPLDMTGDRYGALKQILQGKGEAAGTSHEQTAIFNARDRLNQAFHNSMPADEAERLRQLDRQYSNYKTIENIPTKADQNTISPDQVFGKASRGSDLETHATQAASVMKLLPKPSTEPGPASKAFHGIVGGLFGAGAGAAGAPGGMVDLGMLGAIAGKDVTPYVLEALKNAAGRTVARPGVQSWLKNQEWRPDAYTAAPDKEMLLRLLMSPQGVAGQPR